MSDQQNPPPSRSEPPGLAGLHGPSGTPPSLPASHRENPDTNTYIVIAACLLAFILLAVLLAILTIKGVQTEGADSDALVAAESGRNSSDVEATGIGKEGETTQGSPPQQQEVEPVSEEKEVTETQETPEEESDLLIDIAQLTEVEEHRNQFLIPKDSQDPQEKASRKKTSRNRRTASPVAGRDQHDALAGRTPRSRIKLVKAGGGNEQSEQAVELALAWLAAHQQEDGGWDFNHTIGPCDGRCSAPGRLSAARNGATAMALLPFLGAGETHMSGRYQETVKGGLEFLKQEFHETEGGRSLVDSGTMYSHGLATIALSEAYAMTRDESLKAPTQIAINYIQRAQDPEGGGWRYGYQVKGDTSVVGWQVIALKSGEHSELKVDPAVFRKVEYFLTSVQTNEGAYYGYTTPGKGPSTSAIGLLCRMYLGWRRNHPALRQGVDAISNWGPSNTDMYYNYYAAQLMFQYTNAKGSKWRRWNTTLRDFLVQSQSQNGHEQGSWAIIDGHGRSGGRLYSTSLATLILEVYYRHMPIFQ